jgi:hypothetical protein
MRIIGVLIVLLIVAAVIVSIYAITSRRSARNRARALRAARWSPADSTWEGRPAIVLEKVAVIGGDPTVIDKRLFDLLPPDVNGPAWDAHYAETWGRAANRAAVLNATIDQ